MFYSTVEMSATFSRENHVRSMLRFESALAIAQARAGVIPTEAASAIADGCQSLPFNVDTLYADAIRSGTLAIPLVKTLTQHVGSEAGAYVHWGATSQDAIDTAFMLQSKAACTALEARVLDLADRCADLARTHRATVMVGRTLTQQALPITFGLKAARWLSMLTRQIELLRVSATDTHVVQLGGAVGTLASLGEDGPRVQQYLAEELDLNLPNMPWHTERDRITQIATMVGTLAGCFGKLAGDLLLLAQSEIGEVSERAETGKGGSSTMPHKRNPVDLVGAKAAARLATASAADFFTMLDQEHERSAGAWQAEWELLPKLYQYTDYALERIASALEGLEVHADRMRENLNLSRGLIMAESLAMALARRIGRTDAYRLADEVAQQVHASGQAIAEVCRNHQEIRTILSADEIASALDPASYLGSTDEFINCALAAYQGNRKR